MADGVLMNERIEMAHERLNNARWTLERQLAWIASADIKVGLVFTLNIAMLGGLGAAYTASAEKSAWVNVMAVGYGLCAFGALLCSAKVLMPYLSGPRAASLVFFCRISERSCEDYVDAYSKTTNDEFLNDIATQIHRNAEIATQKYGSVGKAILFTVLGAAPWVTAIAILVMPK